MIDFKEEPDHFIMEYHPYKGGLDDQDYDSQTLVYVKGTIFDQQRKDLFVEQTRNWVA